MTIAIKIKFNDKIRLKNYLNPYSLNNTDIDTILSMTINYLKDIIMLINVHCHGQKKSC